MLKSKISGAENVPNLNSSWEFNSLIKTRTFYFFKTSFAVKLSDVVPLELLISSCSQFWSRVGGLLHTKKPFFNNVFQWRYWPRIYIMLWMCLKLHKSFVVCRYRVCVHLSPECGASPVERIHPLDVITKRSVLCWMWCQSKGQGLSRTPNDHPAEGRESLKEVRTARRPIWKHPPLSSSLGFESWMSARPRKLQQTLNVRKWRKQQVCRNPN